MNVQLALAVLQIPIFYYVLVATDSLEFFRKLVQGSYQFCRKICWRRQKGKAAKACDEKNPMLRKLAVETQQLIASYACATGIVLIGSFYLWSTTVSSRSAFQFGGLPFVWRHYHIVLLSLEMVLFVTLVALKFNCLSMRTMNVAFACAMLLVSCLALPGMVDSDSMVCVSQFMFLFRLTCIPISGSTALVFFALGLNHWCLIWSLTIYTAEVKWYKGGRATEQLMALFSGVWYFDIAAALACVLLHAWLQQALRSRVSRVMETMSLKTEAVASESLLATFCDAHCFLDSDLCFERDERAIASMLLRTGNNAGIKFLSYIKTPEDELRFLKLTRRGENRTSTAVAQAINLGLKDGYNDQVNVELFHVLTQDRLGRSRHLIGLREYSQEAKSGAAGFADDALQIGMRSGEDHSDSSESSSQTDSSASNASSEGEGKEDKDPEEEEAFILFDCEELEIVGASKRLIQKTGIELADGATFREFVAQRDEAEFLFFFVSYVTKATEEGTAQHFEMRLHMNMGKKRRGKAKWRFTIQYQGQVLLARAVLASLKPVVKMRHRKHPTCGGFLPIAEPLDAVVEMDRKPLRRTRSGASQSHSSPEVSITLDMVTGGRKPSVPSMVTTANTSSSPPPPKRRSSARWHL